MDNTVKFAGGTMRRGLASQSSVKARRVCLPVSSVAPQSQYQPKQSHSNRGHSLRHRCDATVSKVPQPLQKPCKFLWNSLWRMIENLEGTKLWNKTRTRETIPALLKLECAHEPPKDLIKMQLCIHWPWGVCVCVQGLSFWELPVWRWCSDHSVSSKAVTNPLWPDGEAARVAAAYRALGYWINRTISVLVLTLTPLSAFPQIYTMLPPRSKNPKTKQEMVTPGSS